MAGEKIQYILDRVNTTTTETNFTDAEGGGAPEPIIEVPEPIIEAAEVENTGEVVSDAAIINEVVDDQGINEITEEITEEIAVVEESTEAEFDAGAEIGIEQSPGETVTEEQPVDEGTQETSTVAELTEEKIPEEAIAEEKITEEKPIEPKRNQTEYFVNVRVIPVTRLDRELPAFTLADTLEIGQYFMVFQVLGEREVLYKIEKPLYFLGNAEFIFDDIQRYLPGFSTDSHLIPTGINIMLEAQMISDKRLDPYVVWYSGRKRIGEGRLAEGADHLIWKAPERTGFQAIRAELFPFRPVSGIKGMVKELSLPISSKSERRGYFSKTDHYIYWYQFHGTLQDSEAPGNTGRMLLSKQNKPPLWLPHAGMYGLSVGPEAVYLLPGDPFTLNKDEQGSGQLLFHVGVIADGTIFKALFNAETNPSEVVKGMVKGMVNLKVSLTQGRLVLTVIADGEVYEDFIRSAALQAEDFITLLVQFNISGNRFTANVRFEDIATETAAKTLILSTPLNGTGTFQFGEENTGNNPRGVVIFNELAVAFTKGPILQEPEDDTETPDHEETLLPEAPVTLETPPPSPEELL
ncbi:MAG: hypothetical protein LBT14_05285 [Treponema sp.]|nr:hypothetical protein [Treponema sp.]